MDTVPDGYDKTPEILRQAWVLVRTAAQREKAGRSTLRYFVRLAASHGLDEARIADAAGLDMWTVHAWLEPFEDVAA